MSLVEAGPTEGCCKIREASAVEVLSLVDNSIDFVSTTSHKLAKPFRQWTRERYGQEWLNTHTQTPIAEHGFSMLIKVYGKNQTHSILFDTGGSSEAIIENSKRMGIDLREIEYIILSHGHYDHFGGLTSVVKVIGKADLPIIAHPDALKTRGLALPNGTIRKFTEFPKENQLHPAKITFSKQPLLIANNMVCITGEIPRKTSYEKGLLHHQMLVDGSWRPDPLIIDDCALVINVKGRGIMAISGCAHAGIINTITYSQQISGVEQVYAVLGGFHLAGKGSEEQIEPTLSELIRISPVLIVPSHCTGWRAASAIARALPDAFVWNSVGNLYQIQEQKTQTLIDK
jgi:7,8-dihydropterin-6-yl-methyl-4-(beta-D-ribofuranosyl)aminobenzene 5'-phosphate synthase